MLGAVTLVVVFIAPRAMPGLLLLLASAQLIMLAGVGHAAMHDGALGAFPEDQSRDSSSERGLVGGGDCCLCWFACPWRISRAGVLPAITAMMRFSRYGHLAVAAVLVTGVVNSLLILGWTLPLESGYFRLLALKVGLVLVMVTLALINRYILVPRFDAVQSRCSAEIHSAYVAGSDFIGRGTAACQHICYLGAVLTAQTGYMRDS
ncbi:Inner membrane protein YebZ [Cedecea neteri]|uniref:Copper resistance protein D n=1 Tax=Cedecea neteri TaxID=158822 RepID=A0A2X3IKI2_9ENTR|nr:Inner membrane protein YebZ [Cedecea neteri]